MSDYMPRTDYVLACYAVNESKLAFDSTLTFVPKLVHTLHTYADATLGFTAHTYIEEGGWFEVRVVHGQCAVLKFHIDRNGEPIATYVQHNDSGQWNEISYATGRRYLRHYRANYGKRAEPSAWFLGERVTTPDMEGYRR